MIVTKSLRGAVFVLAFVGFFSYLIAQEPPPPKPKRGKTIQPKKIAASTTLLVISDYDCNLIIDGEIVTRLKADQSVKLRVTLGQHLLRAETFDRTDKWETVVEASAPQVVVVINLASKIAVRNTEVLATEKAEAEKAAERTKTEKEADQLAREKRVKSSGEYTNSLGIEFVFVQSGGFIMGSSVGEGDRMERPQHEVEITSNFWMGKYEVDRPTWEKVMGNSLNADEIPRGDDISMAALKRIIDMFPGNERPVTDVSWFDVQRFISKLNGMEEGKRYRLPTEAEWEYACRAGSKARYYSGDDYWDLDAVAWFADNSGKKRINTSKFQKGSEAGFKQLIFETVPEVQRKGEKDPNGLGLYDMLGNVYEWCSDWIGAYDEKYSNRYYGSVINPMGPVSGPAKVIRGGSVFSPPFRCRSAARWMGEPSEKAFFIGFRLLLEDWEVGAQTKNE